MPVYVYECPHCKAQRTDMRTIAERHDGPKCNCGTKMSLIPSATPGVVRDPAVPKRVR